MQSHLATRLRNLLERERKNGIECSVAEGDESHEVRRWNAGTPPHGRFANTFLKPLLVLIAVAAALLSSNNWCFILVPTALLAILFDLALCAYRARFTLRAVVSLAVGLLAGDLLSVDSAWAFQQAFGVDPPPGVREVDIARHYVGGPGEHILIIEFESDPAALQTLTSLRAMKVESDRLRLWRTSGARWQEAFDTLVLGGVTGIARWSWQRIRPLESPAAYEFEAVGGSLTLFHEPRSGRCVALHVRY